MSRKVVELFAGVGGFRVGLNEVKITNDKVFEKKNFDFVFFNQWEPNKTNQYAYNCYSKRFNEKYNALNNFDISKLDKKLIPDHDLLVGGFPCQDYSVARTLNNDGIQGKKGVLWWEIYKILQIKSPKFILLENVDRLLISPSNQRGRDFSIMLKCFDNLGYYVEWKVINASDYGMPQKRKRVFIFACKKDTKYFNEILISSNQKNKNNLSEIILENKSFFTKSFPSHDKLKNLSTNLNEDIEEISKNCIATYYDSGMMFDSKYYTFKTIANESKKRVLLKDVLENESDKFRYLTENEIEKFKYLKGSKKIKRISKDGHEYTYSEGKMSFPEDINKPSRTMLTSEASLNRSSHVVCQKDKYRYLTPVECERLNMFPDNWTNIEGIPEKTRYFLMGNALVCGIIKKLSKELQKAIDLEKN